MASSLPGPGAGDSGGSGTRGYSYDGNGNRLTKTVNGTPTTYTYTTGTNRLATVGGSSITTDSFGRTTAIPSYTYLYNTGDGRLQTVKNNGSTVGTYTYDASGLRRKKVAGSTTTIYHYDESGHLLAETNAAGTFQRLYVWADTSPIAQKVGSVLTYLHVDHLDTPRWGTNGAGTLVWRWKSDGFGEAGPEQDVDGNGVDVVVGLRFSGQVYDAESGLHYNWMRDYRPAYGRYVETDPIGLEGGASLYGYVVNDPVNLVDPRGLWTAQLGRSWSISLTAFGVGGAATFGAGTAIDGHGNITTYWFSGRGAALGTSGASGGINAAASDGDTVCDLAGPFNAVALGGGWGLDATGDGFWGQGSQGQRVHGAGLTLGAGLGGSGFVGRTNTRLGPVAHLW